MQHTPSVQKPEVHWLGVLHAKPLGSGVGVAGKTQLPAWPEMLQNSPLGHCATTQHEPSVQWPERH